MDGILHFICLHCVILKRGCPLKETTFSYYFGICCIHLTHEGRPLTFDSSQLKGKNLLEPIYEK